jgi:putative transposase
MYDWRKLTPEEQKYLLAKRNAYGYPPHSPPHWGGHWARYLLNAACYEHRPVIGKSITRIAEFETELLIAIRPVIQNLYAWCILPNHYHLLFSTDDLKQVTAVIGDVHGRTSHRWNGEDDHRGRHVWYRYSDRAMRSERHFWATLNYVHHNPIHHRYAKHWQDWPFSSASQYLQSVNRDEAERIWKEYPVLDYGKDWDDPELL